MTPAVVAARDFPDTSNGIFVFDDQLETGAMSEAQFAFAATHVVGTQKIVVSAVRRLRQINPNFLVLHYRLGQALGRARRYPCPPATGTTRGGNRPSSAPRRGRTARGLPMQSGSLRYPY